MSRNFLSVSSSYNDFLSIPSPGIDKHLLENNSRILGKLYGFLQKNENLLLLCGFQGTGKRQLTNHLLSYLDKNVHSFKIYCTHSMTLDDVLMSLWTQIASVTTNNQKNAYAVSFQDKVTASLLNSSENIIITIYDFDLLTNSNSKDILDFVLSFTKNSHIKTIITSKTFDSTLIPDDVLYTKLITKALSRIIFEKYLNEQGVKATSRMFDELYKLTRGYYLYTKISANILTAKVLSVSNYLVAYTNSCMSFDSFLAKAYVSMLSDEEQRILLYLALMRHSLNKDVLNYFDEYDVGLINSLREKGLINIIEDNYYLVEYFRDTIITDSDSDVVIDIRHKLVEFYNEQLKYKPSERLMLLSRTTMRSENEYHMSFLEGNVKDNSKIVTEITENMTLESLLSDADRYFEEYNYHDALKLYLAILDKYETDKIYLYDKLAQIYERIGNFKYALYYLNLLIEHFSQINDSYKVDKYKLLTAKVYYQTYKTNDAISCLNELISISQNTEIVIDACTLFANLYISLAQKDKAFELYRKAIELSEQEGINDNISELYFKFAILADEKGDSNTAVKNYRNCINSAKDNNKYKSLSYSNLGDFYLDMDDNEMALINFESAYKLDLENYNDYGVYYSASNIAKLLLKKDTSSAYQYLLKAREAALRSKDIFAIANAGLHLGDYYSNNNLPESALNEYFSVLNLVRDKFSDDNKKKIFVRINDIKQKLGEERFNELYGNTTV